MKTAIVLSGGGAKGAYQIGVWKALRKLKIDYSIVTGTSVGALNGLMMVQDDYNKALRLWTNIDYETIFSSDFKAVDKNIYMTYIKQFIAEGGADVTNLEKLVSKVYHKNKFYNSKTDFGIIVYNLSEQKEESILKNSVNPDCLTDYVIASAACYPAFKMKKIDGSKYIDGGYYDNLPINLAIDLGADKIIAVDLKAPGIKQKTKNKNIDLISIVPRNDLGSFLEFDEHAACKDINYGYNDTMKIFGRFKGDKYTFHRHFYEIINKQILHKYSKNVTNILKRDKLLEITKKGLIKNGFIDYDKFQEVAEYAGEIFGIADDKVYFISRYNHILKRRFNALPNIDSKLIKSKVSKKEIKGLLEPKYIVKYIYQILTENKGLSELEIFSTIFEQEFLVALYLMTIIS